MDLTLSLPELVIDGGTLVIQPDSRIDIECITVTRGTIVIDMSEVEEPQLDTPFLFYTCGSTEDLTIVAEGKECSITTSTIERAGKYTFSATLVCPDTSLGRGAYHDTLTRNTQTNEFVRRTHCDRHFSYRRCCSVYRDWCGDVP